MQSSPIRAGSAIFVNVHRSSPTTVAVHQVAFRSVLSERLARPGECAGTVQDRLGRGPVSTCSLDGQRFYELGAAELTGSDIVMVTASSPTSLAPMAEVDVKFTPSAGLS